YKGGGVPLPVVPTDVPVKKTISPSGGVDDTALIQAAIDEVGRMPVQANGYRGAVRLAAGTFNVQGTVLLNVDGVVLSGVGGGSDPSSNTVFRRTGTSAAEVIVAGNSERDGNNYKYRNACQKKVPGTESDITDELVQVGSRSFNVTQPGLYQVGDAVVIY